VVDEVGNFNARKRWRPIGGTLCVAGEAPCLSSYRTRRIVGFSEALDGTVKLIQLVLIGDPGPAKLQQLKGVLNYLVGAVLSNARSREQKDCGNDSLHG
jgi:hypothetical protein